MTGVLDGFVGATPIDLGAAVGAGASPGARLAITLFIPGAGLGNLVQNRENSNRLRQWNLMDTFSIVLGHHQVRLGADYRRLTSPNTSPTPQVAAVFSSAQSLLSNKAGVIGVATSISATPIFNETSVFAQDEWRLTPRLNLSLGLRWEVNPPPHEANGNDAYALTGSVSKVAHRKLLVQILSCLHNPTVASIVLLNVISPSKLAED